MGIQASNCCFPENTVYTALHYLQILETRMTIAVQHRNPFPKKD